MNVAFYGAKPCCSCIDRIVVLRFLVAYYVGLCVIYVHMYVSCFFRQLIKIIFNKIYKRIFKKDRFFLQSRKSGKSSLIE